MAYAKLYSGGVVAERLIGYELRTFASEVVADGIAEDWFFVRYRDPRSHIRLRFRGDPELLTQALAPRLYEWVGRLIADGTVESLAVDPYVREIERYGGRHGIGVAEALFGVDSRLVADVIALELSGAVALPRELLCVLTFDRLLAGLGLDSVEARARWCAAQSPSARHDAGADWREHGALLRRLLGERMTDATAGAGALGVRLDEFAADVRPHAERLRAGRRAGTIVWPSAAAVTASLAHMHCNRMLGIDRDAERRAFGLLHRAVESLTRATLR